MPSTEPPLEQPPWRPSSPDSLEADLAELWRDVGSRGPVSRAFMSNLVVVRRDDDGSEDVNERTVEDVTRRHPARTIILRDRPELSRTPKPGAIRVTVRLFGESSRRYGVEMIAAETAFAEECIPSLVRRLALGGAPTSIWWTGDICDPLPPVSITTMGRQLLFDSAMCCHLASGLVNAGRILSRPHPPDLVDLNWRRLAPMRNAVIHTLRAVPDVSELHPSNVGISYQSGSAALAWLLAGWLHRALDWPATLMPEINEGPGAGEDLTGPSSSRLSIVIGKNEPWSVRASMTADRIAVEPADLPPFSLPIWREPIADAIADELTALSQDTAYAGALSVLAEQKW